MPQTVQYQRADFQKMKYSSEQTANLFLFFLSVKILYSTILCINAIAFVIIFYAAVWECGVCGGWLLCF
jgi:hypothetical protein